MNDGQVHPDGGIPDIVVGDVAVEGVDPVLGVARDLKAARLEGQQLVVVVSAMGDTTDRLAAQAYAANAHPPRRELDMLLTVGERISMSLLSMALAAEDVPAVSFTGSQAGIITDCSHTDARILAVRPIRLPAELAAGKVVVVAGFQGVCGETKEITTLGRGGSDTTAVALAHALGATRCEILKDVPGVMTADPKLVPTAQRISRLDYDDMLRLAAAGCGVVHAKAVAYAREHNVDLFVGSSFENSPGTTIGAPAGSVPEPPSAFRPLALTVGRQQAQLRVIAHGTAAPPELIASLRGVVAAGPVTAEWLAAGDLWTWEAWGPVQHLSAVAAAARDLAAARPDVISVHWEDEKGIITLVGSRPESWSLGLEDVATALASAGLAAAPRRSDGDTLRILVPAAKLTSLAATLHTSLLTDPA